MYRVEALLEEKIVSENKRVQTTFTDTLTTENLSRGKRLTACCLRHVRKMKTFLIKSAEIEKM